MALTSYAASSAFHLLSDNVQLLCSQSILLLQKRCQILLEKKIFYLKKALGRAVQKPVNANPVFKGNRRVDFSFIKMFLTA